MLLTVTVKSKFCVDRHEKPAKEVWKQFTTVGAVVVYAV